MKTIAGRWLAAHTIAVALTIGFANEGAAQDPALPPAVAYRQNVMRMVAAHMNAVEALLEEDAGPQSHMVPQAQALLDLSIMTPDLFPAGSGGDNTRARDEIWQDPSGFAAASAAFVTASEGLLRALESGNEALAREGLETLSASCGGCHQPFRKPAP